MLWEAGKGFACGLLLFSFLLLSRSEFSQLLRNAFAGEISFKKMSFEV